MADILQTISIVLAAWAVVSGVNAWKREFIGKRRIELVQDVLALFYEAQDAISAIRSPFGFEGEGESREKKEMESPEETKARNRAYAN